MLSNRILPVAMFSLLGATLPTWAQVQSPETQSQVLHFACKQSFHNKGDGVCEGVLQAGIYRAPYPLAAAVVRCDVRVSYWWQDSSRWFQDTKKIEVTQRLAPRGNRFVQEDVPFTVDVTSVMQTRSRTQVSNVSCEYSWQYQ